MLPLVVVALVSAANPEPVKLAATPFQFVNLSPELATFCSEHFAQQLTLEGIRVTTPNEISTLLGFERQRELMGCTDKSTSCLAELANALGVDGLITGTVGKFGKSYQVNIKILSAADARPMVAHSGRVKGEEDLIDEYTRAAQKLAPLLLAKLRKSPAPAPPPVAAAPPATVAAAPPAAIAPAPAAEATTSVESSPLRRWFWVPAAAGAVAAGVGAGLLVSAGGKSAALTGNGRADGIADVSLTPAQAAALASSGASEQVVGGVLIGVGVAAVAGGAAMFVLGSVRAQPTVALAPGGAAVAFTGSF